MRNIKFKTSFLFFLLIFHGIYRALSEFHLKCAKKSCIKKAYSNDAKCSDRELKPHLRSKNIF